MEEALMHSQSEVLLNFVLGRPLGPLPVQQVSHSQEDPSLLFKEPPLAQSTYAPPRKATGKRTIKESGLDVSSPPHAYSTRSKSGVEHPRKKRHSSTSSGGEEGGSRAGSPSPVSPAGGDADASGPNDLYHKLKDIQIAPSAAAAGPSKQKGKAAAPAPYDARLAAAEAKQAAVRERLARDRFTSKTINK